MADSFISQYIEDLLKNIRMQVCALCEFARCIRVTPRSNCCLHNCRMSVPQVVLKLIQPYTRIRIPYVSKQLNVPEADVEQLLVSLILDGRIRGSLDQARMHVQSSSQNLHRCCQPLPAGCDCCNLAAKDADVNPEWTCGSCR